MSKTGFLHIAVAVVACAIVVVLHLVEIPVSSQAAGTLIENLHAPGFGIVAVGAMLLFRRAVSHGTAFLIAGVYSLALALASEAAQYFSSRDADIIDFGWDLLGIGGFLALAACANLSSIRRAGKVRHATLLIIGLLATSSALAPVGHSSWILAARALALPVVAEFDHSWEANIYRPLNTTRISTIKPPPNWPVQNGRVLAIDFAPIRYSGVVIDPYPDWTEFESISFLAASADGKEHELNIRIHDISHNQQWDDRYNDKMTIGPDVVRYEISLEDIRNSIAHRPFDMSRIMGIVLFKVDATNGERLLIDDFRLEKGPNDLDE